MRARLIPKTRVYSLPFRLCLISGARERLPQTVAANCRFASVARALCFQRETAVRVFSLPTRKSVYDFARLYRYISSDNLRQRATVNSLTHDRRCTFVSFFLFSCKDEEKQVEIEVGKSLFRWLLRHTEKKIEIMVLYVRRIKSKQKKTRYKINRNATGVHPSSDMPVSQRPRLCLIRYRTKQQHILSFKWEALFKLICSLVRPPTCEILRIG